MQTAAPQPLVSVILRSLGRPELSRALASVERQAHRPLEIVFVDAGAAGLRIDGRTSLPVVTVAPPTRLLRVPAANAGMEAAHGDWLLFLDEDDEIEPTHVQELLGCARENQAQVAYSQTQLLDRDGRLQRLLGGPWRRDLYLQSNYIAIHAALFSRRFVDAGHRFDASYELFEDWDFWLQLAQHGDFAFTGRATARYYAASGQSGGGAGANLDRALALAQRDKLLRKWSAAPG